MNLSEQIARAIRNKCYVSFVPDMPSKGMTRVSVYRKGKLGTERYVTGVRESELALALCEINDTVERNGQ